MAHNQNGFSAVALLLLLALIITFIGLGGWYVRQKNEINSRSNQTSNENKSLKITNNPTKTDPSDSPKPEGYLTITNPNVRLPLSKALSALTAGPVVSGTAYSTSDKSVSILAPELDASWECVADDLGNKASIGEVSITLQARRAGPGEPSFSKKIGANTFAFEPADSNCTNNPKFNELVSNFQKQFVLLEAY